MSRLKESTTDCSCPMSAKSREAAGGPRGSLGALDGAAPPMDDCHPSAWAGPTLGAAAPTQNTLPWRPEAGSGATAGGAEKGAGTGAGGKYATPGWVWCVGRGVWAGTGK